MPLETMTEPAKAIVVGLPLRLNTVHLRSGRMPTPGRTDEAVVSDAFAEAHQIALGDELPLVLGGVRRDVRVVGVGLSPEYVMVLSPGDMAADNKRQGVLFMGHDFVAAALDLDGSFNSVAARLTPDADEDAVLEALDRELERYGGFGAHGRDRQMSHFILSSELDQLQNMTQQLPPLFLIVAAFLLHVVLTRLIQLQRPQVAALKALGYLDREIGLHYLKLASVIVVSGASLGVLLGAWLGDGLVGLYEEYFRFPNLRSHVDPQTAITAILVSTLAAIAGTLTAVRSVLRLAPAEAMRPPAPATYRRGLLDARVVRMAVGPAARMVLREVQRRPLRLIFSAVGIAIAVAILVTGRFFGDAMAHLVDVQLHEAQRWDVQVSFAEPRPETSLRGLSHIPGVFHVEGLRQVPVRLRYQQRTRDVPLIGYPGDGTDGLQRPVDEEARPVPLPVEGVVLTRMLGDILELEVGDRVLVEVLEGDRPKVEVPVAGFVAEPFGLQAHMRFGALHELLGEEPSVSAALLRVDPERSREIDERLTDLPDVVGITHMDRVIAQFKEQSQRNITIFSLILTLFAATIAIGVVYNNARVALSMRSRDLASLRVLGFTRAEISAILLGELALQVFLAIPIGLVLGQLLSEQMATGAADPEMYRFPVIIAPRTYAFATVVTLGSAFVSALLVRRKLDRLDLIGVLKTRE